MNEEDTSAPSAYKAPEAQVQTKRSFSIIWVVPIIALVIGGWLAYKAMSEKGPIITITFENAEGLKADKTTIKFKDVEIGKVTAIEVLDDLSGVVITAEMRKKAEKYMTENTRFWVVRARVAAGEVSGLNTLFSGAYIGCSPSPEGLPIRKFTGLEKPPVLTEGLPGRHFTLQSKTLGSLDIGSPVFYRGIKVGQVVEYDFTEAAEAIHLKVFVNAPFDEKVRENTRFWNASGVDFTLDATGIKMDTQSLVSIMVGGIAFDLPLHAKPADQADENSAFLLYASHDSSKEKTYDIKRYYLMYFDQSVRGLSPGAPVEIRGIKIGEVINIELQYDLSTNDFHTPVLAMIEPERINALITEEGAMVKGEKMDKEIGEAQQSRNGLMRTKLLVDKGLRAQLKTGNLLTGQLYIDLDFHPDAAAAELKEQRGYEVFPTIPVPLDRIMLRIDNILKQVEQVPIEKIGTDVEVAVKDLNALLQELRSVSGQVNRETLPGIKVSLEELNKTLQGIDGTFGQDSALNYNSRRIMDEFSITIRSLRSLLNYLERDPQALILGKEGDKR